MMCTILRCMIVVLLASLTICQNKEGEGVARRPQDLNLPSIEAEHDPTRFAKYPTNVVNGSVLPPGDETPDWRLPEPTWYAYQAKYLYMEKERPYRMSPHYRQAYRWSLIHKWFIERENIEYPQNLGCYCTTVYKRLTVLAGCAVLTLRHILTTATPTELVIRDRHNDKTLINILGAWYDVTLDVDNSSMYMTPARIHYHPKYLRAENVNITHPLPVSYDLCVWASTYPFHKNVCFCLRANSGWWEYGSTVPRWSDMAIIVGFQYIRALRKKPMPWFKYAVRTQKFVRPCPKTDWGWYHCLEGSIWSKYGVESGAAWHRSRRNHNWMTDGLAAMNAFSLRLRSNEIIHYFTVLNQHPVIDFMYDAYMGRLPYEYLDQRFWDTQWRAPVPKSWYYVPWNYRYGDPLYYKYDMPYYK